MVWQYTLISTHTCNVYIVGGGAQHTYIYRFRAAYITPRTLKLRFIIYILGRCAVYFLGKKNNKRPQYYTARLLARTD